MSSGETTPLKRQQTGQNDSDTTSLDTLAFDTASMSIESNSPYISTDEAYLKAQASKRQSFNLGLYGLNGCADSSLQEVLTVCVCVDLDR